MVVPPEAVYKISELKWQNTLVDELSCAQVLKQPWHFKHNPLILKKWLPGSLLQDLFSESIELWVKFFGVPVGLVSGDGLSHVVSPVGHPILVDTKLMEEGRYDFINVLIKMDSDKPRLDFVKVKLLNGKSVRIRVQYQEQPVTCELCKRVDHTQAKCRNNSRFLGKARGRRMSRTPSKNSQSRSRLSYKLLIHVQCGLKNPKRKLG